MAAFWLGSAIVSCRHVRPGADFTYLAYGALPYVRSAFYGIRPVILAIFEVAVYRLGKNAIKDRATPPF